MDLGCHSLTAIKAWLTPSFLLALASYPSEGLDFPRPAFLRGPVPSQSSEIICTATALHKELLPALAATLLGKPKPKRVSC